MFLTPEIFENDNENPFNKIHNQVKELIRYAKKESKVVDAIFKGYNESAIFAQRYTLLYPETISKLIVGGASSTIPIPTVELEYPLGIKDFEEITGIDFSDYHYRNIIFKYYVSAFESLPKNYTIKNEKDEYAPLYDLSDNPTVTDPKLGKKLRDIYGVDIIKRSKKQIETLKDLGIKIDQTIFEGRTNNDFKGYGVNELGDEFVKQNIE